MTAVVVGVMWTWGGGFLVAALAKIAIADALYRRKHPHSAPMISMMIDVTLIGVAMVVVQLEPVGIGAPFIYMLVVPAILLPWSKAWCVMAYAAMWSLVALFGFDLIPLTADVSPTVITIVAFIIFAGHTVAIVAVFASALDRSRRATELAEQQNRYMAAHDPLTGLANRALLTDRIEVALADARRNGEEVAVIFIDLDHFKLINDSAGHTAGDELLERCAKVISELVRDGDSVGRVGGDEFVMLVTRIADAGEAAKIAERVVGALRQNWKFADREFSVTASAGIAMYPMDGGDPEALLKHADTAMYRAKDQGRDRFQLFSAAMNHEVERNVRLEKELRQAMEREEFFLHYQPQVDSATQAIVGVEALLRWKHPQRGIVHPVDFIGVAEESGLMLPIGEWVLATACAQLAAWRDAGLADAMPVTVNLSARQFHDAKLADKIRVVLHETGLAADRLELEITETAAMYDLDRSVRTLDDLGRIGVGASIDDFGTGFSSLSSLRRLEVQRVKIDKSFVNHVVENADSAAIVTASITLAETLGMGAVAEGVETSEQLAFLQERRCPTYQGYLFSEPVSARLLEEILANVEPAKELFIV